MVVSVYDRIFTIPPGVNFLRVLADAVVADHFQIGLGDPVKDPLALANTTIYLPTRRAARVLRSEIADRLGGKSALLPIIRPLGETDDDSGFFDEATPLSLELAPAIGNTEAILTLAELVLAWKAKLPEALSAHLQGAPMTAPANPADAIWLGKSLHELVQAVEAEEADITKLDNAIEADLQQWWQLTAEFLKIAWSYWPARLSELQRMSPAARHNALIDAETQHLGQGRFKGPVIVAGSTGTRPSTARLIAAISRHQQGAVVLPGLDQLMTPDHWSMLAGLANPKPTEQKIGTVDLASVTVRSHPQYGLLRLIENLGLSTTDISTVRALEDPHRKIARRNRLVSLALLPSVATTVWSENAVLPQEAEIGEALADVTLIEAANEREEAAALAAAMRAALEPAKDNAEPTVALVTPNRNLARRVVIELRRHGIEADDSGGRVLSATPQGSLARLVARVAFAPGDPVALAALIKHPLARFGKTAAEARQYAEHIELLGLRGGTGAADPEELPERVEAGAKRRNEKHAANWLKSISDDDVAAARLHADVVRGAFAPMMELFPQMDTGGSDPDGATHAISALAFATARTLELIADDGSDGLEQLWGDEAGKALAALLTECRESESGPAVTGFEWIGTLEALLSGELVKPEAGGHPRAQIWGTLEARLQHVDTVLLAGLNEGEWPSPGTEDPFLSRSMKSAIGLEPPERRIGQAAHDFQMAMAMDKVVLSRSLRSGSAPTVASRWLQRLIAAAGPKAVRDMQERGKSILDHMATRANLESTATPGRPEPRPEAALQPGSFSFSEVKTLRRDPYAIYARRVLKLDPVDAFISDPGPRERGTLFHEILERFIRDVPSGALSEARLLGIADQCFSEIVLPGDVRVVWRNRLARAAPHIVAWETQRADRVKSRHVEIYGLLELSSNITLRGIADRIEIDLDGNASLIDYKTGGSPSKREARTLLDPQLALEAHVLMQGGFKSLGKLPVSELLYLRLTGNRKYEDRVDEPDQKEGKPDYSATALAERAINEFEELVLALRDHRRGFMSRVIPKSARDYSGDYDHLARVAEWQIAAEDGGGDDD